MLRQKLQEDLQKSLREGRAVEVSTIRMALSAIVNKEKEKRAKLAREHPEWGEEELQERSRLADEEVLLVLSSEAKKRREASAEFKKGGRQDLAEKEEAELKALQQYLPKQLSIDEIRGVVKKIIQELGAEGPQDMGKVMAKAMGELKGRAEGGEVSEVVKSMLERK